MVGGGGGGGGSSDPFSGPAIVPPKVAVASRT